MQAMLDLLARYTLLRFDWLTGSGWQPVYLAIRLRPN